jgi:aspartyl-tRNA(Asn)/glutamyl-tRNA(Gln) amidotransferase subunit A
VVTTTDLAFLPATDIAEAIRAKQLSAREVTQSVLDRIDEVDGKVNAFVTRMDDEALMSATAADDATGRGDSLGVLHGVPVSIKDLFEVKGVRCTQGSLLYKDSIAQKDSPSVARLRREGAIIIGTTNSPEFGMVGWTDNKVAGRTNNPWNLDRIAGGSSGGAGAAAAAGMAPLALGSDGGGSIRIPSCFCGIFGLKPTWNLVPKQSGTGGWATMSHAGPMTRTVADAALMMDAIAGYEPGVAFSFDKPVRSYSEEIAKPLGKLRVAWSPNMGYGIVDPEVASLAEAAAKKFSDLGCEVEEADPDWSEIAGPGSPFVTLAGVETYAGMADLVEQQGDKLMDYTVAFVGAGKRFTTSDYIAAQHTRVLMWDKLTRFFEQYHLLLTPSMATVAFPHGQQPRQINGVDVPPFAWSPFTTPFNLTGVPAATVPAGFNSEGLPVGLQIVGPAFHDHIVLRAAAAYEQAAPWADQRPSL